MQTATDSYDLRSVQERLTQLKSAVATTRAAEAEILKAKAGRYSSLRREATRYKETETEKLDVGLNALNEDFKHQLALLESATEQREARAQRAYHSSKAALAKRAQDMKDRKIGHVQGEIMRNRQSRQLELEQANHHYQIFRDQLIADRKERRDLQKSILSAFRSFLPCIEKFIKGQRLSDTPNGDAREPEVIRVDLLGQIEEIRKIAGDASQQPMAKFFRFLPLWLLASVIGVMHLWWALRTGGGLSAVLPSLLIAEFCLLIIWAVAFFSSRNLIRKAAVALATSRKLEIAAASGADARLAALGDEIKNEQAEEGRNLSETFRESGDEWRQRLADGQQKLEKRYAGIPARLNHLHQRRLEKLNSAQELAVTNARKISDERVRGFETVQNTVKSAIDAETNSQLDALALSWQETAVASLAKIELLDTSSRMDFPKWTQEICETWEPPTEATDSLRIGSVDVDITALTGGLPSDSRFQAHDLNHVTVPLALAFPDQGSLLIESDGSDDGASTRALHGIALRILASHPPGRVSFVFIDPVGLGKDFAGLMHLADYEETLIHHRIWTQTTHIEERLAEINDHIEKVIQMYLRDEFANITEYNQQAGTIAEKYRFLVIAGFPAGFSDTAAKRLLSIASSGARCGVHLLIQRDTRQAPPESALYDELRRVCLCVTSRDGGFQLDGAPTGANLLVFDRPPVHQDSIALVHRIGRTSVDSNRVQVPFSQIAPSDDEIWKSDTSEELRVPVGRTGAKKLQMLAIGKGTRQHMLVAGKTGSGKSTLFHVIITNLSLWCSPDQVEFYLVDFKKGVEFKCYAAKQLPHARVVAIESDREFALSVLQRVDAELKRRGELFRQAGAQDLAGYKRSAGSAPMPRTLLLIDEFQEFFTEDDAVAQEASLLLDRVVRQGRAFGIHVILGSQTLGGAYTLARATLGQMVIRVALQCNETDAHLIMDDDNPAPRLLTRPGEGIYNDQAGALAANSPFQIVWLPEDERDAILDRVSLLAAAAPSLPPPPIVFEGNAPADVRDNLELARLARSGPSSRPQKSRAWLGAPNSIKGPTEAMFQRQSGSHLLVVGQSVERSLALLTISLVSLAAQYPVGQVEFVVLDPHASEAGEGNVFQHLARILPHRIRIAGPAELTDLMSGLGTELAARTPNSGRDAPEIFLLVHELQRFKNLRPEDDFRFSMDDDAGTQSPAKVFTDVLGEGGPCGMHVIAATDTWNNVSRWIPRKLMSEFEMRVLFQMSANDSANLIDSPAATTLGLHRAIFFNEHLGTLETYRPYAMPGSDWLEEIVEKIKV